MTDKPKFGDAVNVPVSEMAARGIGNALTEAGVERVLQRFAAEHPGEPLTIKPTHFVVPKKPTHFVVPKKPTHFVVPKKPRAKYGTATYGNRDPDARRKYLREYMAKRRAKARTVAV